MALCILTAGVAAIAFVSGVPLPDQNLWSTLVSSESAERATVVFLYPLSLLYVVCPESSGVIVFHGCHVLLAAIGTFLLVHRWTRCRIEAFLAGGGASLCLASMMSWLPLNAMAASSCLPLIIWFADRALVRDRCAIIPLACAVSAQMLTGSLPIILLTWLGLATLTLDFARHEVRDGTSGNPAQELALATQRLAAVLLIASGLCATQLLPFLI